jgi:hypothetical protein
MLYSKALVTQRELHPRVSVEGDPLDVVHPVMVRELLRHTLRDGGAKRPNRVLAFFGRLQRRCARLAGMTT